jgi:hypothetical protein
MLRDSGLSQGSQESWSNLDCGSPRGVIARLVAPKLSACRVAPSSPPPVGSQDMHGLGIRPV